MAFRLNHLFQTAPQNVLASTVIFVDALGGLQMRHKLTHFVDLEPVGKHAHARTLEGLHQYEQDAPLVSYFTSPGAVTLVPREDPPHRFVFLPEFTNCRLVVSAQGDRYLRFQLEENLVGAIPPPDPTIFDSFAYWDYTKGLLVGTVRGTAVAYKQPGEPWTITMQQIIGNRGHELVRQTFTRCLNIP